EEWPVVVAPPRLPCPQSGEAEGPDGLTQLLHRAGGWEYGRGALLRPEASRAVRVAAGTVPGPAAAGQTGPKAGQAGVSTLSSLFKSGIKALSPGPGRRTKVRQIGTPGG